MADLEDKRRSVLSSGPIKKRPIRLDRTRRAPAGDSYSAGMCSDPRRRLSIRAGHVIFSRSTIRSFPILAFAISAVEFRGSTATRRPSRHIDRWSESGRSGAGVEWNMCRLPPLNSNGMTARWLRPHSDETAYPVITALTRWLFAHPVFVGLDQCRQRVPQRSARLHPLVANSDSTIISLSSRHPR